LLILWYGSWKAEWCSQKRQPLLSNSWENTFPQRRINTQQQRNCWKLRFLCAPCRGYITRPPAESELVIASESQKEGPGIANEWTVMARRPELQRGVELEQYVSRVTVASW
jgi:hypothetical protein